MSNKYEIHLNPNYDKTTKIGLWLSIVTYVCSLFFVGFHVEENIDALGWGLLVFGFFALKSGGTVLVWIANPVLWISWLYFKNKKISLCGSILATLISLSFLLFDKVRDMGTASGTDMHSIAVDSKITGYGSGYYIWTLSSIILLVGNCLRFKNDEQ